MALDIRLLIIFSSLSESRSINTAKVAKDLGGDIKIVKFTRFQKGEGLEKRADDFAAEVASMVK